MKILKNIRHSVIVLSLVGALTVPVAAQAGGVCVCAKSGCICVVWIR